MSHAFVIGIIALIAIVFLGFCYWSFACTRNARKSRGTRSVYPLGEIESSSRSKKASRNLWCLLLAALWITAPARAQSTPQTTEQLEQQVQQLQKLVQQLQSRVETLEKEHGAGIPATTPTGASVAPAASASANQGNTVQPATPAPAAVATSTPITPSPTPAATASASTTQALAIPSFLDGTTLNFTLDGYYEYNFNQPIGQMNQLRAYDISSNSFSLNQADIVVNHPTDAAHGKRIGGRLDLMFGQATETLQGNANNELHPSTWRNVFQAYGTYVAPVGSGLNIDFGKWASALGVEGNYTKDQLNYSRSYYFNFLPFYHMGFRTAYTFNPKLTVAYWLVNGAQQTDAFSGFKSQNFAFTLHPVSNLSWQINYFFGQQQRTFVLSGNPDSTQTATPITPTPNGKEHIFDSYATWNITPKWTLVGEGDYVINRVYSESARNMLPAALLISTISGPRNSLRPRVSNTCPTRRDCSATHLKH